MPMCVPECTYVHHTHAATPGEQRGIGSPRPRVNRWLLASVGAENRTWVLCKSNNYSSLLSHFSSHPRVYECVCVCVDVSKSRPE